MQCSCYIPPFVCYFLLLCCHCADEKDVDDVAKKVETLGVAESPHNGAYAR